MERAITEIGLSPEQVERIKAAQKRHTVIDPGCENLTPEQIINWHPVGGISWEERARRMEAAGVIDPHENKTPQTTKQYQDGLLEGEMRGIKKTARNALAKGMPVDLIHDITGLEIETIEQLAVS